MSTEFRIVETDEWLGVRWAGRPDRAAFDWGADYTRPFLFKEARPAVVDEAGSTYTWAEFTAEVLERCTWTYGEFGGTFALGSGDLAVFEGTDTLTDLGAGCPDGHYDCDGWHLGR
jgi:hypothetical protein